MAPTCKGARRSRDDYELKQYGTLWKHLDNNGDLPAPLKTILERMPVNQLDALLTTDKRGHRLLFHICLSGGGLPQVKYAMKTLRLDSLPPLNLASRDFDLCPVLAALKAKKPQVGVVRFLISCGYKVTFQAFRQWAVIVCSKSRLRRLLEALLKDNDAKMPPVHSMFYAAVDNSAYCDFRPLRKFDHMKVLRDFVEFDAESIRCLANDRFVTAAGHLINPRRTKNVNDLIDIYEYCEVARFYYMKGGSYRSQQYHLTFPFFRKSFQCRERNNFRETFPSERISFGKWKFVSTIEDLDRIERQMVAGDFVEAVWLILFAGIRVGFPLKVVCQYLFRVIDVDDLIEIAAMKSFVQDALSSNDSIISDGDKTSACRYMLSFLKAYCRRCIRRAQPSLRLLPGFYQCYAGISDESYFTKTLEDLRTKISKMDINELDIVAEVRSVRKWCNETLFVLVLLLKESVMPTAEPLISELLCQGASIMALPGKSVSTLLLLLQNAPYISETLRDQLVARMCCPMDTSAAQLEAFGMNKFRRNCCSLRCLAAAVSRPFISDVDKDSLPTSVLEFTLAHPDTADFL